MYFVMYALGHTSSKYYFIRLSWIIIAGLLQSWACAYCFASDFHTAHVVKKLAFLLRLEHPFLQGTSITPTYSRGVPNYRNISLKI
jgi:hypothetical protein